MLYLILKATISWILIAAALESQSDTRVRSDNRIAFTRLRPVVIWLWRNTHDPARLAAHPGATFWFVLSSLPILLLIPSALSCGAPFRRTLAAGSALTVALYGGMVWVGARFGLRP